MPASDCSTASGAAFKLARALAKALHAELVLCHAYQPMPPVAVGEGYVSPRVIEQIWTAARTSARGRLERLAAAARRDRLRFSPPPPQGAAPPAHRPRPRPKRGRPLLPRPHRAPPPRPTLPPHAPPASLSS